ncbi:hypothetical protein BDR06DRAFT_967435 [Suillus hirtellus]|nr:hypothetical protein BDR06DRAFT_967435 [Suillus hirtellus]
MATRLAFANNAPEDTSVPRKAIHELQLVALFLPMIVSRAPLLLYITYLECMAARLVLRWLCLTVMLHMLVMITIPFDRTSSGSDFAPDKLSNDAPEDDPEVDKEEAEVVLKQGNTLATAARSRPSTLDTWPFHKPPPKSQSAQHPGHISSTPQNIVKGMNPLLGPGESEASAGQNASGDLEDVHPYAKIALGVLSCASKMVIVQSDRNQAVHGLVSRLDRVYDFMIQDAMLGQISSMLGILGHISQQTLECTCFIRDYPETKSFWKRLWKDILTKT